jgi:hypothetical protein
MYSKFAILFALYFSLSSCALFTANKISIRAHPAYKQLGLYDQLKIERVMSKIESSDRKAYYYSKLKLLLDTPQEAPEAMKQINEQRIQDAIDKAKTERQEVAQETGIDEEEYMSIEEEYEHKEIRHWKKYTPEIFGHYFYVAIDDPTDILVHIQIHLHGDPKTINSLMALEDAVEKHLNVQGFNVNLVFVDHFGKDVFDINTDPTQWPSSENWSGGYVTIAHELMHVMGLPDEYDLIENHMGNKYLSVSDRLQLFLQQMNKKLPYDASEGIMCFSWKRPLERHVCSAVGLGDDCVKARKKAF